MSGAGPHKLASSRRKAANAKLAKRKGGKGKGKGKATRRAEAAKEHRREHPKHVKGCRGCQEVVIHRMRKRKQVKSVVSSGFETNRRRH